MSEEKICTPFELKEFAFAEDNPTAFNLARFIKSKSDEKYTVIEQEFITDALKAFNEQAEFSTALSKEFKTKWQHIIKML